jgi:6-phosphogluconolactonase
MKAVKMTLWVSLVPALLAAFAGAREYIVYVGTYTREASRGIYAYRFQPSTGKATPIGLVAETVNPSFLAVDPERRFLYAANEISNYEGENGSVSAFSIDIKTGRLTFLDKVSSGGSDPCHVAIDRSGTWLIAANYGSGSVAVFPIGQDGTLGKAAARIQHSGSGKDPRRQEGPHAHSVLPSPDNRFLLVSDLGLDRILVYRLDVARGSLEANDPPFAGLQPGAGPRHLSFHPNGRFVYQINELNSTITAFAYDPGRGSLQGMETISTLPRGYAGTSSAAEITVHPNGRFVYGSNRGHDSIALFAVKGNQGTLEPLGYVSTKGRTPRQFAIDPTGNYLFVANQDSDEVVLFRINRRNGTLAPTGAVLKVPMPVCVVFVPVL